MLSPIGVRGSRLAYGSWKTICIRRRYCLSSLPLIRVMSRPSKMIEPAVGSMRRRMSRPTVVLPHPDSPTRPTVSPRRTTRSTPSTAWTVPTWRCMMPPLIGKCLTRPRTSTSGAAGSVAPPGAGIAGTGEAGSITAGAVIRPARPCRGGSCRPVCDSGSSGRRGRRQAIRSSGCTSAQPTTASSVRMTQRGAKRHAGGRSMRFGTLPGITSSESRMMPGTGIEPISPRV